METPTNPLLKVMDIAALAKVAHSQPGVREVMKLWKLTYGIMISLVL